MAGSARAGAWDTPLANAYRIDVSAFALRSWPLQRPPSTRRNRFGASAALPARSPSPSTGGSFVIAVDGPAASGKGTIAAKLGAHYGLPVLDSGLLYRAVGVTLLADGADLSDEAAAAAVARRLDPAKLDDPTFRTGPAGEAASRVAAYASVRLALRDFQRAFARQPGGAVIDGRDIGTVIAPDAPAKLFVTGSAEARARRRWLQLKTTDPAVAYEAVLTDIQLRDERDAGRADSPMTPAADAVLLDTTEMTIPAAVDAARRIVEVARARWESRR